MWLPVAPVGLELTVQDGQVTKYIIIACENPSEEYPERWCEPTRHYYWSMGIYTIEELFDIADECTLKTRASLANCPAFAVDEFHGFEDPDNMFNMAQTCKTYLQTSAWLCAVKYDAHYGFPKTIVTYDPSVLDGSTTIIVKEFQVIQ
jgi:hypothetical protein